VVFGLDLFLISLKSTQDSLTIIASLSKQVVLPGVQGIDDDPILLTRPKLCAPIKATVCNLTETCFLQLLLLLYSFIVSLQNCV